MSADIPKMFHEVELHKDDRDLHRILQSHLGGGCHGHAHDESNVWSYLFSISGNTSAMSVAKDHKNQYPRAAKTISNFYMDDYLMGAATPEEAI